jgi:hypothetical protein
LLSDVVKTTNRAKAAPRLRSSVAHLQKINYYHFSRCPVIVYKASAGLRSGVYASKIKEISAAFTPKITQKTPSFCMFWH